MQKLNEYNEESFDEIIIPVPKYRTIDHEKTEDSGDDDFQDISDDFYENLHRPKEAVEREKRNALNIQKQNQRQKRRQRKKKENGSANIY